MPFFSSHPKVVMEDFCRDFYDGALPNSVAQGMAANDQPLEKFYGLAARLDGSLADVDESLLLKEINACRIELFGLAWSHRFTNDKLQVPQSVFTLKYLKERGLVAVWDVMAEYNKTIAESVTLDATGRQAEGSVGRAKTVYLNEFRLDLFKVWEKRVREGNVAPEEDENEVLKAVSRVINRFGADVSRNDAILVRRISAKFAARIGLSEDIDFSVLFALSRMVFGLYTGPMEILKHVNLD